MALVVLGLALLGRGLALVVWLTPPPASPSSCPPPLAEVAALTKKRDQLAERITSMAGSRWVMGLRGCSRGRGSGGSRWVMGLRGFSRGRDSGGGPWQVPGG